MGIFGFMNQFIAICVGIAIEAILEQYCPTACQQIIVGIQPRIDDGYDGL